MRFLVANLGRGTKRASTSRLGSSDGKGMMAMCLVKVSVPVGKWMGRLQRLLLRAPSITPSEVRQGSLAEGGLSFGLQQPSPTRETELLCGRQCSRPAKLAAWQVRWQHQREARLTYLPTFAKLARSAHCDFGTRLCFSFFPAMAMSPDHFVVPSVRDSTISRNIGAPHSYWLLLAPTRDCI